MSVHPGQLVIVSGPSGAGKTSVLREVFVRCRRPLVASVSATTRSPRPGEIHGKDYYFLSKDEFASRREAGEFLECCEVYGRGDWYGTLMSEVAPRIADGKWVVLEIDVQGTFEVVRKFPEALTIFIQPESVEELERRLIARGTEGPEQLARRLDVGRREMSQADRYRHKVINQVFGHAIEDVCRILEQGM